MTSPEKNDLTPEPSLASVTPSGSTSSDRSSGGSSQSCTFQRQMIGHFFQGPLPPPAVIEAYGKHIPDGANRVMLMAEQQAKHRQQMERDTLEDQKNCNVSRMCLNKRGQWFGFLFSTLGILLGGALAFTGHDGAGSILIGTAVVPLGIVFVTGRINRRNELIEEKKNTPDRTQAVDSPSSPPAK